MNKEDNKCEWKLNELDCFHETDCGHLFFFDSGDVKDNNFKYCPYCGKQIKEKSIKGV